MYKFLKEKTLLYVEDEKNIRENVTELIADYFGVFHTASTGEEGYEKFLDNSYDIVISDIELPQMSGIDLLGKIRKSDKNIHLVIISAHTKIDYLLSSIPFKLEQYLIKPLNSKKIRELLSTLNDSFSENSLVELTPSLWLNREKSVIIFKEKEESLTKKELGFLSILVDKKVISYDEIDRLWGYDIPSQNAIRSMIKKLRRKLPKGVLHTRVGFGYYVE